MRPEDFIHVPFVKSVLHPTDFSDVSDAAFAHALAIALRRETAFTLLHAGKDQGGESWSQFPPVRSTLERWGLLEPGSDREDVFEQLNIRVRKYLVQGSNMLSAALDYVERQPTDLIVLATEGRKGLSRWVQPSRAERLARRAETRTLFVPQGARGIVSMETGDTTLRRILVPVDVQPDPEQALVYAARAAEGMSDELVDIITLHVGVPDDAPEPLLPESEKCRWSHVQMEGSVVDAVISVAQEREVDLIVMATAGHDGILDALRGSVTEQVLRQAPCPLLAIPS